jgi:hypothetical protein
MFEVFQKSKQFKNSGCQFDELVVDGSQQINAASIDATPLYFACMF